VKKILIIEDEQKIARFLALELNHEGYSTRLIHDGREGADVALGESFDLVILDIMLPGLNGIEVCRRIRNASKVPIIMLTARDDTMDKVIGLDMGADDYMTKPFAIEELLARIRKIFRNSKGEPAESQKEVNKIILGPLEIDKDKHKVSVNGDNVQLTKKEYDLLLYLSENKGIVLSRDKILESVWGFDYYGDTNVVDVYVRYIRSKVDERCGIKYIHTVRGVGYMINFEPS
jgi:two-component system, OmpR family, response regulator ArlR